MPAVVRVTQTRTMGQKPPAFTFGRAIPVPGCRSHRLRGPSLASAKPGRPNSYLPCLQPRGTHAKQGRQHSPSRTEGDTLSPERLWESAHLPVFAPLHTCGSRNRLENTQQAMETDQSPKGWRITTGNYEKLTPAQGSRETIGGWGCFHSREGGSFLSGIKSSGEGSRGRLCDIRRERGSLFMGELAFISPSAQNRSHGSSIPIDSCISCLFLAVNKTNRTHK